MEILRLPERERERKREKERERERKGEKGDKRKSHPDGMRTTIGH